MQWESHHSLSSKYSVIGTLTHRAKVVCTTPELLKDELKHLKEALGVNINISRVQNKVINSNWEERGLKTKIVQYEETVAALTTTTQTTKVQAENHIIAYTKGTAESIKHICGKYGIQVHFKVTHLTNPNET